MLELILTNNLSLVRSRLRLLVQQWECTVEIGQRQKASNGLIHPTCLPKVPYLNLKEVE